MIDITNKDIKKSYNQIKKELKSYSSKLSKKKELVILNKTDLIEDNQIKEITEKFSKAIKSEVITLSTLDKKSVSNIKSKLLTYLFKDWVKNEFDIETLEAAKSMITTKELELKYMLDKMNHKPVLGFRTHSKDLKKS